MHFSFGNSNYNGTYNSYRKHNVVRINKPWQSLLFGLLFLLIGIGLCIFSFNSIKDYNKKNETFIATTAIVSNYDINSEGNYAIIIKYTVNGSEYTATSKTYSSNPKSEGSIVKIKYNPERPQEIIWVSEHSNIITVITAILFTFFGGIMCIFSIKNGLKNVNNPEQNNFYDFNNNQSNLSYNQNNNQFNTNNINNNNPNQTPNQNNSNIENNNFYDFNNSQSNLSYNQNNNQFNTNNINNNNPNQNNNSIENNNNQSNSF